MSRLVKRTRIEPSAFAAHGQEGQDLPRLRHTWWSASHKLRVDGVLTRQPVEGHGAGTGATDGRAGSASQVSIRHNEGDDLRGRLKHRRAWTAAAVLLVAVGTVSSFLAASALVRSTDQKYHKGFITSSVAIASTLQLAIQHEQDLIVSASGYVASNPSASNEQFNAWVGSVDALGRYPELVGIGHSVIVPASALPAFAAEAVVDPTGPLAANGTFAVVPAGNRPFYCLSVGAVTRSARTALPAGTDFCAEGPLGSASLASRSSGKGEYVPIKGAKRTLLSILTPVYAGGVTPTNVSLRKSAFIGWVGMSIVPELLLARSLVGHPDTAVTLRYRAGRSNVQFRSGQSGVSPQLATIVIEDGWTVEIRRSISDGTIFSDEGALGLLIGGISSSILLAALIYVLATGRARLSALVASRTDELQFQSLHDSLTGLPNRALIVDRIEQLLMRNRRNGTVGAALYIDLDDFKNVNDSLGHEAGDQLLVAVATRMASTLRGADSIGRMGGDEFVVLIDGSLPMVAPELVAQRLLDVMQQPFELDGSSTSLYANTSIGIAVGDRVSGQELLRDADIALYKAKATGKNRYEFFHPDMQSDLSRRISLEFDLRAALISKQLRLLYQPIYNLDDLSLVGVEALLRWDHPTDGLLLPDEFVPILEQTGQIREVGAWVLRKACAQLSRWHAQGQTLTMAVNVSARQLDDDRVIDHIRDALNVSGLDPRALIVEVTETALMRDAKSAARRLRAVKDLGVSIAVDDFGTGFSSLSYLQQFPVDCIKIDKSFISSMGSSPGSLALIRTFVQLGRDLGLKTLAEGVETRTEMELLRADHVNEAQGFLFSGPLEPEALEIQVFAPMRSTDTSFNPMEKFKESASRLGGAFRK